MAAETTGSLSCLNVGAGDIEIVFNNHDRGETKKALRMLTDMAARALRAETAVKRVLGAEKRRYWRSARAR